MSTPMQQQTRQRKMIYFGAIVVLFTLSLIHREFVVKPQAYRLQLREEARGEAEFTSSAIRLLLTGSRGVAVTMLWYNAMDKQKRNEWNKMDELVTLITKLQPYFVTPWLYQSWNFSFNVAVECDRPRDKYYYISRGLEMLAEGERRNRGSEELAAGEAGGKRVKYPGNPEMRHYMGFFYQLKIGTSDERLTMRTLMELSCIDPVERNPEKFMTLDERGQEVVDLKQFLEFSQSYPRTVRRLRDQLDYADPKRVVQFLKEYQDIPSRFFPVDRSQLKKIRKSEIRKKPEDKPFPILPPPEERHWPDPGADTMTNESIDVFLFCRTWYEFAQKPLPPPDDNPRPIGQDYDKTQYRVPKQMVTQLFRQYPARAQVYIAEGMEEQGFIDGEGWDVAARFTKLADRYPNAEPVGKEPKHQSRRAWDKGYEMYRNFGLENGLIFRPKDQKKLEEQAAIAYQPKEKGGLGLKPGEVPDNVPPAWRDDPAKVQAVKAALTLNYSAYFRRLANFEAFYNQAEGEKDPITAAARRTLFAAERRRKGGAPSQDMLKEFDHAWALYTIAALKYPKFAQVSSMQEDLCEAHQRYLAAGQKLYSESFKKRGLMAAKIGFSPYSMEAGNVSLHGPEMIAQALAFWPPSDWRGAIAMQAFARDNFPDDIAAIDAKLAFWPTAGWRETIVRYYLVNAREKDKTKALDAAFPIRMGPLDSVEYYDGPMAKELKEDFLFQWAKGAGLCQNMSVASTITYPGIEYLQLSRMIPFGQEEQPKDWKPVISPESRRVTMDRLGLNR